MKLQKYEILIGDKWEPVNGTTVSLKEGWLEWTDGSSSGLARPGTWRFAETKKKFETAK
jgi:hypothetical protein